MKTLALLALVLAAVMAFAGVSAVKSFRADLVTHAQRVQA